MPAENQTDIGYANVPQATALPSISGRPVVGATLTRTSGSYTNTPTAVNGQWTRNRADIAGATGATYVLTTADRDMQIGYYELPSNANGVAPKRYHAAHTDAVQPAEVPYTLFPRHSLGSPAPKRTFGGLGAEGAGRKPAPTQFRLAIQGDSRAQDQYADLSTKLNKTSSSYFNVANALLGQVFTTVVNYGNAGRTSAQYLVESEIAAIEAGPADYVSIYGWVNDLAQGRTSTEIIATVEPVVRRYLAAGKQVFLYTEPGSTSLSLAAIAHRNSMNTWARDLANKEAGVRLFDMAAALLENPDASVPPVFKSEGGQSYSYDGTHYSYLGVHRVAEAFAEWLRGFANIVPLYIGATGNLVPNVGFRNATGGSLIGGVTGQVPANVVIGKSASVTAVLSVVPGPGLDNILVADITAGASAVVGDTFSVTLYTDPVATGVALGDTVVGAIQMAMDPGATNVQSLRSSTSVWFDANATNVQRNDIFPTDPKFQVGAPGGYSLVGSADPVQATRSGATVPSRIDIQGRIHFNGPGRAVVRFSLPHVRKL